MYYVGTIYESRSLFETEAEARKELSLRLMHSEGLGIIAEVDNLYSADRPPLIDHEIKVGLEKLEEMTKQRDEDWY